MRYTNDQKCDKTLAAHINCPTCGDIIFVESHIYWTQHRKTGALNQKITFAVASTLYTHTDIGVDNNLLDDFALKIPANHSFGCAAERNAASRHETNEIMCHCSFGARARQYAYAIHPQSGPLSRPLTVAALARSFRWPLLCAQTQSIDATAALMNFATSEQFIRYIFPRSFSRHVSGRLTAVPLQYGRKIVQWTSCDGIFIRIDILLEQTQYFICEERCRVCARLALLQFLFKKIDEKREEFIKMCLYVAK